MAGTDRCAMRREFPAQQVRHCDPRERCQLVIEALLAAMIALAPDEPVERLRAVATAIASATESPIEAAVLVTISLYETNFERAGIPFGLFSWRHRMRGQPLEVCASAALRMYRFTQRCGDDVATRLGWYHTGHCAPDSFSRREARTVGVVRTALEHDHVRARR